MATEPTNGNAVCPATSAAHAADLELVRCALSGERTAIDEIARRLVSVCSRIRARHRCMGAPLNEEELADVVQDTLVAVWRKLSRYEGRASLETWACHFGARELRKGAYKRYRDSRVAAGLEEPIDDDGALEERELPVEAATLHACLEGLAALQARVVREHVFEQRSFPEIARTLRIPLGTAKAHYYRGLLRLRAVLSVRMKG